jgi:hypothetical protein
VITVSAADQTAPGTNGTFAANNSSPTAATSVTIASNPGDLTASVGSTSDRWVTPGSTGGCGVGYGCAEGGTIAIGWHLVTATYDGVTGKLYVDGAVVASDTFTAPSNTNFPLYVGSYYGGGYWSYWESPHSSYCRQNSTPR